MRDDQDQEIETGIKQLSWEKETLTVLELWYKTDCDQHQGTILSEYPRSNWIIRQTPAETKQQLETKIKDEIDSDSKKTALWDWNQDAATNIY